MPPFLNSLKLSPHPRTLRKQAKLQSGRDLLWTDPVRPIESFSNSTSPFHWGFQTSFSLCWPLWLFLCSIKVSSELAGQQLIRAKERSGHHGELSLATADVNRGREWASWSLRHHPNRALLVCSSESQCSSSCRIALGHSQARRAVSL